MNVFRSDEERDGRAVLSDLRLERAPVLPAPPSVVLPLTALTAGVALVMVAFSARPVPVIPPVVVPRLSVASVENPEPVPVPPLPSSFATLRTIPDFGLPSEGDLVGIASGGAVYRIAQVFRSSAEPVTEKEAVARAVRAVRALAPPNEVVDPNDIANQMGFSTNSYRHDLYQRVQGGRVPPPGVDFRFVGRHPEERRVFGGPWRLRPVGADQWSGFLASALKTHVEEDATERWRGTDIPARGQQRRPYPEVYHVEVSFGTRRRLIEIPLGAARQGKVEKYLGPLLVEYGEWAARVDAGGKP